MATRIAINGYGRIGRNVLRAIYEYNRSKELQIVAVNDLGDAETNAHLTRYDTAHGKFPGTVKVEGDHMVVNGDRIRVCSERDPAKLPWKELKVDVVFECTGLFRDKAKASAHITAGASKVLLSAPGRCRRGCDHRVRRQSRYSQGHGHRGVQCLVHDQLPGAAGKAAA